MIAIQLPALLSTLSGIKRDQKLAPATRDALVAALEGATRRLLLPNRPRVTTRWRGHTIYLLPRGAAVMQSPTGRTIWTKRLATFADRDSIALFVAAGAVIVDRTKTV